MIPEPRDYRGWRRKIAALVATATKEHHVETWQLPAGMTYRITGRPLTAGQVVLQIEDITAETSLARGFRAELNMNMQVLDSIQTGIIVFDADGNVVICNQPYAGLWGARHQQISGALVAWRGEWADAPGLADLEAALGTGGHADCRGILLDPSHEGVLNWTVSTLTGGNRMVRFHRNHNEPVQAEDATSYPQTTSADQRAV